MCSIGAATQGWDQTGSNGANLSFPAEFGIASQVGEPGGERDEWIVGFVNAAPYISSALAGCWLSDPLNNWFGRRGEIFITSIILIATPIGSAFTQSWVQLAAARIVMGLGMGAKAATVPMYAAEMSPPAIRGALVMGWQLWTAFGIFLGFIANVIVKDVGKNAWRMQLASCFIPAVPLAAGIMFCPESPRWYMKKNRLRDAFLAMCKIRNTEVQAARDIYYAHIQVVEEVSVAAGSNSFTRFIELFTIPRCRRATLAAGTVMLAQQMCGINIISFYSSTIFAEGGYTVGQALYASIGFGATEFVFAFVALYTIDKVGRRALLLMSFPNMAWVLLATGLCFYIPNQDTRTSLVAFFIYLFGAIYSVGEGPVPFMYSAEVFPLRQREQGMAFAVSWCLAWAAVLGLTFPRMLRALKPQGAFGVYAGMNVVALVWIWFFVPETKQMTLEELDTVFDVKTAAYGKWQTTEVAPWWIKRHICGQQGTACPPLPADAHDRRYDSSV